MKISLRHLIALTCGFSSIVLGQSAYGFSIYFGEDLNNSATTPLTSLINSRAAEASFLDSLVEAGTEKFEGFSDGTSAPLSLNFGEAGIATLQGSGTIRNVSVGSTNGFGRYSVSGTKYVEALASSNGFTIGFSKAIAAFGFAGVDLGDFGGTLNLVLSLASGGTKTLNVDNTIGSYGSTDGTALFYGLIADKEEELFTSIAFQMADAQGDVFAFDNMTIGSWQQVAQAEPTEPEVQSAPVQPEPETQSEPVLVVPVQPEPETQPAPEEGSTNVPEPGTVLGLLALVGATVGKRR